MQSQGKVLKAKGARSQTLLNVAVNLGELHRNHRDSKLPSVLEKQGAVSQLSFEIKWCCVSRAGPSSSSGFYHKCNKGAHQNMCTALFTFSFDLRMSQEKNPILLILSLCNKKREQKQTISACGWYRRFSWTSLELPEDAVTDLVTHTESSQSR